MGADRDDMLGAMFGGGGGVFGTRRGTMIDEADADAAPGVLNPPLDDERVTPEKQVARTNAATQNLQRDVRCYICRATASL